jgi:hypothetical protein
MKMYRNHACDNASFAEGAIPPSTLWLYPIQRMKTYQKIISKEYQKVKPPSSPGTDAEEVSDS